MEQVKLVELQTKYRNIVICGDIGTGTTTLSMSLASKLGWPYISAGDFFRDYANKHNIPLWDKAKVPDEIERKVDSELFDKMKTRSNVVFDAHYGGWFARNLDGVLRILLICDEKIATKRILERKHTPVETVENIEKRRQGLRAKFKKLYSDDDYENPNLYHIVIDTAHTNSDQTFDKAYQEYLSNTVQN